MIALALLAAVQTTPAAPPEADIVVVARRLQALSVIVGRNAQGRFTCSLSDSSGSPTLDVQLCLAASKCVEKGKAGAAVSRCIDKRKPGLLADLRASRESGK